MKYRIQDMFNYGVDNGISEYAIEHYVHKRAEEIGLDFFDYSTWKIAHELSRDKELEKLAQETYVPYPIHENWSEEYKARYRKMIQDRTAPGVADIPDELVYGKVDKILQEIADRILPERRAKEAAVEKEKADLLAHIEKITTSSKKVKDEGGYTIEYIHTVEMRSGNVYTFSDRNVFDVGRVINPTYEIVPGKKGGIASIHHGQMYWESFSHKNGWEPVRPLTEEERIALTFVTKYRGHCHWSMRM